MFRKLDRRKLHHTLLVFCVKFFGVGRNGGNGSYCVFLNLVVVRSDPFAAVYETPCHVRRNDYKSINVILSIGRPMGWSRQPMERQLLVYNHNAVSIEVRVLLFVIPEKLASSVTCLP